MPDAQSVIHEVLGVSILSDHYCRDDASLWSDRIGAAAREPTVERFLNVLSDSASYRWKRLPPILLLRSRPWWLDDQRELDPALAKALRMAQEQHGYLQLPELAGLRSLTEEQLLTVNMDYAPHGQVGDLGKGWAVPLAVFTRLSTAARLRLQSPSGLAWSDLPAAPRALWASGLPGKRRAVESTPLTRLRPDQRERTWFRLWQTTVKDERGRTVVETRP
jgi:hypothetical protein